MENMNLNEEVLENAEEIVVEEVAEEVVEEVVEETAEETATQKLSRKCNEVKAACCGTIDRIARDLKETNFNPYIKQTRTYKLEIYRTCNDEEPIDVYETTDVKSYSARAMVVATAAAAALMFATDRLVKKLLK